MNGQWRGQYAGSGSGEIIANVDQRSSYYEGVAYLIQQGQPNEITAVFFRTTDKQRDFQVRTGLIRPVDPRTSLITEWNQIKDLYPDGTIVPEYADVKGSWEKDTLTLSWITNIQTEGHCVLQRANGERPSDLKPLEENWDSFRDYVAGLKGRKYLFRGQNMPWRLRTSFHRAGRADVQRFWTQDVPALHKHLSARTRHVFNLQNPDENGAFFNLVQHHGYPTPLLDWTYSPYVAAFFAYRGISNADADKAKATDKVRVLVFDQAQWREDLVQLLIIAPAALHVSIGEFSAIENERMIPQQGASLVTNVDDIETYIRSKESANKTYLSAIDLPVLERERVMRDLGYMGITAGSLFPGLDGACEELKERNFDL